MLAKSSDLMKTAVPVPAAAVPLLCGVSASVVDAVLGLGSETDFLMLVEGE